MDEDLNKSETEQSGGERALEAAGRKEPKPKKAGKPEESKWQHFTKWCVAKFMEYKSEFKKIVWPSRQELFRQSLTVIVVSLIFGAYIAAVDGLLGTAFTGFVNLVNR